MSGILHSVLSRGNQFMYLHTISATTTNFDLLTSAQSAGWSNTMPLYARITINSSVIVGSSDTLHYAFTVKPLPFGSVVIVNNYGYIVGAGGKGGNDTPATSGTPGGPAILLQYPTTFYNYGTIAGGGGGGGFGYLTSGSSNWDGNGGAGFNFGPPGTGQLNNGNSGTLTNGGTSAGGGAGGNLGFAGAAGGGINGTSGGAAGFYITGSGYVSWAVAGTLLGQVA